MLGNANVVGLGLGFKVTNEWKYGSIVVVSHGMTYELNKKPNCSHWAPKFLLPPFFFGIITMIIMVFYIFPLLVLFVTFLVMVFYSFPSFVFLLVAFSNFFFPMFMFMVLFVMVCYYFPFSIFLLVLVLAMVILSPF